MPKNSKKTLQQYCKKERKKFSAGLKWQCWRVEKVENTPWCWGAFFCFYWINRSVSLLSIAPFKLMKWELKQAADEKLNFTNANEQKTYTTCINNTNGIFLPQSKKKLLLQQKHTHEESPAFLRVYEMHIANRRSWWDVTVTGLMPVKYCERESCISLKRGGRSKILYWHFIRFGFYTMFRSALFFLGLIGVIVNGSHFTWRIYEAHSSCVMGQGIVWLQEYNGTKAQTHIGPLYTTMGDQRRD